MSTLTDQSQFQALTILQGKHQLAPAHSELMDWISKQYGVEALDFFCETRATPKGPQQLVHVILNTAEEVKQIQANRAAQAVIADRFLQYFKSVPSSANPITDPLKHIVLSFATDPFPEVIVTYRPLKTLSSRIINEMYEEKERAVLKTFESVWTLSQAVIFFYTDAQVKENQANGMAAKIIGALDRVHRTYGFKSPEYRYDSKETFDRDYKSNWYYYWK